MSERAHAGTYIHSSTTHIPPPALFSSTISFSIYVDICMYLTPKGDDSPYVRVCHQANMYVEKKSFLQKPSVVIKYEISLKHDMLLK